jgi:hypothetical protein
VIDAWVEPFSWFVFIASICLIIYIVYYEYSMAKINAENAKIRLGEKENEDLVDNLSDSELVQLANKSESGLPSSPTALDSTDPKRPKS